MMPTAGTPGRMEILQSIVAYMSCSASMLLLNKLVMTVIPLPSFVAVSQFVVSCITVLVVAIWGHTEIEPFRQHEITKYIVYVAAFVAGLWCNMKSLQLSNVETVIVFRSCTPLAQAFLDYFFLQRELPDARSLVSLLGIALGAYMYMMTDSEFQLKGYEAYYWVSGYFGLLCFQMTYGKIITNATNYSLSSTVLYNNGLAIVPMALLGVYTGEMSRIQSVEWSSYAISMLALSCIVGTGISYSGWWCRALTTATVYTTLGVLCKFATVLLNMIVWDKHASAAGTVALLICLVSGTMYQEAPVRKKPALLT